MIIGGSERHHGAPALASIGAYAMLAALRIGVGYVVEYVPKSVIEATRAVSPNIIVIPLHGKNLGTKDIPILARDLRHSECLVIGPGIGKNEDTCNAVIRLIDYIKENGKRAVIDADALYALSRYKGKLNMNFIITPNIGELGYLIDVKLGAGDISGRIDAALKVSKKLNVNVLIKGHEDVITDGKRIKLVKSKSSALATMGTGDVLAGMIGAYAAKNSDIFIAGVAGAYLHSFIGDMLYKEKGNHILASDVVEYIPRILKGFDSNKLVT